jgi:hypothetical protein
VIQLPSILFCHEQDRSTSRIVVYPKDWSVYRFIGNDSINTIDLLGQVEFRAGTYPEIIGLLGVSVIQTERWGLKPGDAIVQDNTIYINLTGDDATDQSKILHELVGLVYRRITGDPEANSLLTGGAYNRAGEYVGVSSGSHNLALILELERFLNGGGDLTQTYLDERLDTMHMGVKYYPELSEADAFIKGCLAGSNNGQFISNQIEISERRFGIDAEALRLTYNFSCECGKVSGRYNVSFYD